MRRVLFIALIIVFVVSSCRGGGETPQSEDIDYYNGAIQWSENPSHIIFQADLDNPTQADERGMIPQCTLYGDGRAVWTVNADDPLNSVLFGPVDVPRIRVFVNLLVLADIYNRTQLGDLQNPRPTFVETIRLNVNDSEHISDLYGGWTDIEYYDVLERCQTLSPRPQVYRPDALWLYVEETEYDSSMASILWEADITGVDLGVIAESGQPRWIEGRVVHLLWAYYLRSPDNMQYSQNDRNFTIGIEIPNVTRNSPPAP